MARVTATRGEKGRITRTAQSRLRLDRLRHLSAEGVSFEEAIETVGMTYHSVVNLLRKHHHTAKWPIAI